MTFVDCGQTAIDRLMISSLSYRANIWLRQATNRIEIGLTVSEQWRLQWGYPPFRVDRDRLIGLQNEVKVGAFRQTNYSEHSIVRLTGYEIN